MSHQIDFLATSSSGPPNSRTSYGGNPTHTPNRLSRDEMNLAEFPLSVLSTRVSPNKKTLEFEDTIYDKRGNPVLRQWIITAADKFGLPTSSDDEVLLGLLKISVDRGLDQRKVYFTRYELLRTLRWSTEGRSYKRLTNALDRLSGVRIKASNSFYDNEAKSFNTRNFGIIDEYEINSGKAQNPKPSFFVWSEVLHKSFSSGFIKKLDFDFFLSLESAVSKRLYRFLDKHFWYRSKFKASLFTVAHEKIGVSRTYKYPSSLRQQIDPAVEELVKAGFLSHVEYSGKGKHTEVTFFAAGDNGRRSARKGQRRSETLGSEQRKESSSPTVIEVEKSASEAGDRRGEKETNLFFELTKRGINPTQADKISVRLQSGRLEGRAREILDYFDKLVSENSKLVSRNAPGFLYRALQNPLDFCLPGEVGARPKPTLQVKNNAAPKTENLESQYLTERRRELSRLMSELEPTVRQGMEEEVRGALQNIRSLVSDSGFEEAVTHGVEEKVAKLFALPSYTEWCKGRA